MLSHSPGFWCGAGGGVLTVGVAESTKQCRQFEVLLTPLKAFVKRYGLKKSGCEEMEDLSTLLTREN